MSIRGLSTSTITQQVRFASMAGPAQLIRFAKIGATTGSPATGQMTDGDGVTWNYYDFTGNGSVTVDSPGYVDVLVVGGGGAGARQGTSGNQAICGGGAGAVRWGLQFASAATHTIVIGAGGSGGTTVNSHLVSNPGSGSSFGTVLLAGGGGRALARNNGDSLDSSVTQTGGGCGGGFATADNNNQSISNGGGAGADDYGSNEYDGITLNYNGSSIEFGVGGYTATPVANTGSGGDRDISPYGAGTAGRVIVRVPA